MGKPGGGFDQPPGDKFWFCRFHSKLQIQDLPYPTYGADREVQFGARSSDGHVSRESGPSHMRCSMVGGSDMIQNPETALQVSN